MTKVIEPPVLLSRTLTFVLAASVAVLATLGFSLYKMAPLTRPEVFFLVNQSRNVNYVLKQPDPKDIPFKEEFIEGFIRTYIIARNSLESPKSITIDRWNRIVKPWSSLPVYTKFKNTNTYTEVTKNRMPGIVCSINFNDNSIAKYSKGYRVVFDRTCFDKISGRQTEPKSYKIDIAIKTYLDNNSDKVLNYLEGLRDNPLGIQITEYTVVGAKNTDPLSDMETDFYKEGF